MASLVKGPVARSVCAVLRENWTFVRGETRIGDLELDSFELEELAISLRETCGIEISGKEISGISTLEELAMRVDPEGSIVK